MARHAVVLARGQSPRCIPFGKDMNVNAEKPPRKPPKRGKMGGRVKQISLRLLDHEYARLRLNAANSGLSAASYLRAAGLGDTGPRARRSPNVNLAALGTATAAVNKLGGNINQIARALNFGEMPEVRALAEAVGDIQTDLRLTLDVLRAAAGYANNNDP